MVVFSLIGLVFFLLAAVPFFCGLLSRSFEPIEKCQSGFFFSCQFGALCFLGNVLGFSRLGKLFIYPAESRDHVAPSSSSSIDELLWLDFLFPSP